LHADPGAEGEAGNPAAAGFAIDDLQPVERGGGIAEFANAMVEQTLAPAHATRVEPQHGKAALGKHIEEIVDDLVVHRPTELGVGMQHDGDGSVRLLARLVTAFQTAFGSVKDHFWHGVYTSGHFWLCWRGLSGPSGDRVAA